MSDDEIKRIVSSMSRSARELERVTIALRRVGEAMAKAAHDSSLYRNLADAPKESREEKR